MTLPAYVPRHATWIATTSPLPPDYVLPEHLADYVPDDWADEPTDRRPAAARPHFRLRRGSTPVP